MKNILTFLCFFLLSVSLFAQSWQRAFHLLGTPESIVETSNGDIHINYFNPLNSTWEQLVINPLGDSIEIQSFIPQNTNAHSIIANGNQTLLRYLDNLGNIIWDIPITLAQPDFTSLTSTNSGLAVLYYQQGTASNSTGEIWVYNQFGDLVFHNLNSGPLSINGWEASSKYDGSLMLKKYNADPWLPQGASESDYEYYLLDPSGVEVCMDFGNASNWNSSRDVHDLAMNGHSNCGAIGNRFSGTNFPNGLNGQFIPCSDAIIPFTSAIPNEIELIGLQTDGFAALGIRDEKVVLTRMDCAYPIVKELCLVPTSTNRYEMLCLDQQDFLEFDGLYIEEAGTYSFNYLDANGCDSIVNLLVNVDSTIITIDPAISINNNVGTIDLNCSCTHCAFKWSNGSSLEDLVALESGLYSVTVSSSNECSLSFDFNLDIPVAQTEVNHIDFITMNSLVEKGAPLVIKSNTILDPNFHIEIYTLNGNLWSSHKLSSSMINELCAPFLAGIYFIGIYHENKRIKTKKLVVV